MTGVERNRRYLARLRQRAAAATGAASVPPPPSPPVTSLPTPRLAESLEPERKGISYTEGLIESGWTLDRVERFAAAVLKTVARHREAEDEPEEG
jgi:hypothetical protein